MLDSGAEWVVRPKEDGDDLEDATPVILEGVADVEVQGWRVESGEIVTGHGDPLLPLGKLQQGVGVGEQHERQLHAPLAQLPDEAQQVRGAYAAVEGALGGPLVGGAVGDRVGERQAKFEDVGAIGLEHVREIEGQLEAGIAHREVRDEGLAAGGL